MARVQPIRYIKLLRKCVKYNIHRNESVFLWLEVLFYLQIIIEGVRGMSYRSDIAIDDVTIIQHSVADTIIQPAQYTTTKYDTILPPVIQPYVEPKQGLQPFYTIHPYNINKIHAIIKGYHAALKDKPMLGRWSDVCAYVFQVARIRTCNVITCRLKQLFRRFSPSYD